MGANNELLNKLKEFLSDEEIKQGIEKGVIKLDIEKGDDGTMKRMPLTHKTAGLDSGTGAINETMADSASWEMVMSMMAKAFESFEKASKDMMDHMAKADYMEDKDKDMEKAHDKMMSSADMMKKNMKMYKGKMNMQKGPDWEETQGMKKMAKSEDELVGRIEKSFNAKLEGLSSKNDDLEKTNTTLLATNQDLQKSMSALTDQLGKLQDDIGKIGREVPVPKSVNYQAYIEKGGVKDDGGKKIYHIGMHKDQIVSEMEKAKVGLDDLQKAQIDDDILNYSGAGVAPSEATSRLLFDNHNVKLVK